MRQSFWKLTSFNSVFILRTESIVLCSTRQSTSNPHLLGCSGFVLHGNFFQGFSRKYFSIPPPSLWLSRRSVLMQGVSAACVHASIGPKLALRWLCSGPTGFGKQCSTLTYPSRTQPWLKTHFWQNTSQKECMKERETESERKRGRLLKLEQYITVEKTLQKRGKKPIKFLVRWWHNYEIIVTDIHVTPPTPPKKKIQKHKHTDTHTITSFKVKVCNFSATSLPKGIVKIMIVPKQLVFRCSNM